ncbi:hypothetical protein [Fictibacillus gelatini]|nr:hypothetical protein [Fictibacillus gelatini]
MGNYNHYHQNSHTMETSLDYYYQNYMYHAKMCEYYYKKMFGDDKGSSTYALPPNIEVKEKWKKKTTYEKTYTPIFYTQKEA